MAGETELLVLLAVVGVVLLLLYLYIGGIEKALETVGFSKREAGAIIAVTLFLGWIPIPLFPYDGWWVAMSLGGAAIPLIICYVLIRSRRAPLAESVIGIVIVTTIAYFVTRAEAGVGIVADFPFAFAPSAAAGLYSLSVFWVDVRRAAPLAYVSGVLGTLVGADVFRLREMLSLEPPAGDVPTLVIGGATIFDMVYLSGIAAVFVAVFVLWAKKKQQSHGLALVYYTAEHGEDNLPYAEDVRPTPSLKPRRGRLETGSESPSAGISLPDVNDHE